MSAEETSDIVEHVSAVPFDAAPGRLTAVVARDAGLEMPPATVLPLATRPNPAQQISPFSAKPVSA